MSIVRNPGIMTKGFPYPKKADELTEDMLAMSPEELAKVSRYPLTIFPTKDELYRWLARTMADEIKENNSRQQPTRWILPVGPKSQYPLLAKITNNEHISWHNVYIFHMDEWLDWQGRPLSPEHPLSFRGFCQKYLYNLIDPELRPPASQVVFPSVNNIDEFSERIQEVGGIDTTYAGFGYRGHVAFNEPPCTRWHKVTVDELASSKTRIVPLLEDTIIALSQRFLGGYTQGIPRMAITVGMADILNSKKIYLITDGGAWKRYVLRVLLLTTEPDVEFPVTLCHNHPNVFVVVDADSVAPISVELKP